VNEGVGGAAHAYYTLPGSGTTPCEREGGPSQIKIYSSLRYHTYPLVFISFNEKGKIVEPTTSYQDHTWIFSPFVKVKKGNFGDFFLVGVVVVVP